MEAQSILLIILSSAAAALLLVRWMVYFKKTASFDLGAAMTIGTRQVQEDDYGIKQTQAGHLLVLADGMGESYGGRIAARTAVETFGNLFTDYHTVDNPNYFFRRAFHAANREMLKALDFGQNGTASVGAAIVSQNKLFYAVAGNIKICVYRRGDLVEVSTGHTIDCLAQETFASGRLTRQEAIALLEDRRLYNYLGQDGFCDVELFDEPIPLQADDVVVLMSDGVYDCIAWKDLEKILQTGDSCQQMALKIVEQVNQDLEEDKDNASVVLMRAAEGTGS